MFGWRRRDDGFVWQEYVRTTILLRRKARRQKLGEAGQAALSGIADVGKRGVSAGASGAGNAARGLWAMSRAGGRTTLRAARVGGAWLAKVFARGWVCASAGARAGLAFVARHGGRLARRSYDILRYAGSTAWRSGMRVGEKLGARVRPMLRRELSLPVGVVALAALGGGVGEFLARGFSLTLFGMALLALIAGAFAISCRPVPVRVQSVLGQAGAWFGRLWRGGLGIPFGDVRRAGTILGAACLGLVAVTALYFWAGPAARVLTSVTEIPSSTVKTVEGFAKSLSGDTLRIDGTVIRLSGIEAPELLQRCTRERGRKWACGRSALQALRKITGDHRVACDVEAVSGAGPRNGRCRIGELDIAGELVRKGHVFAQAGLFSDYGPLEGEARAQKIGVWRGEPVRPKAFREKQWTLASQKAPNGCPVKGPILASRGKVYLMPWSQKYKRYRIKTRRGDRWFCSEQEALEAGWKPFWSL